MSTFRQTSRLCRSSEAVRAEAVDSVVRGIFSEQFEDLLLRAV